MLAHLRRSFTGVRDLHLSLGGVGRYHLYVQLAKRTAGEAKNVIAAAFGAHYDIKHVVVVDEDVDVHDGEAVEWAVATRFQADRDLVVIAGTQGSKLDPSTADGLGAKMGLDATVPLDADTFRYTKTRIPGEDTVDLDAALDPKARRPGFLATPRAHTRGQTGDRNRLRGCGRVACRNSSPAPDHGDNSDL